MGKIIVIDGLDGCGKRTQVEAISNRLQDLGYRVKTVSFPKYESLSSGGVRMYLAGEIDSNPDNVNPYLASLLYSIDRGIQFFGDFKKDYDDPNCVILLDRYISANIIYQTSKLKTLEEKHEFFRWLYDVETNKIGIPVEDIVVALTLPIEISQKLMTNRYSGDDSKKDIHEKNIEFLSRAHETLDIACEYLPKIGYNWVKLDCSSEDGWIKPLDEITDIIMNLIKPIINNA